MVTYGSLNESYKNEGIYLYDIASMEMSPVLPYSWKDQYPTISPSGKNLVFISERTGRGDYRIWVYNTTNKKLRTVFGQKTTGFLCCIGKLSWLSDTELVTTATEIQSDLDRLVTFSVDN